MQCERFLKNIHPILSGSSLSSYPGPGDSQCEYNITMNNFLGPFYWWLGEVVWTYTWYFVILRMQVEWWGHSKSTCSNHTCFNFLHSQAVGGTKTSIRVRVTWRNFHYLIFHNKRHPVHYKSTHTAWVLTQMIRIVSNPDICEPFISSLAPIRFQLLLRQLPVFFIS